MVSSLALRPTGLDQLVGQTTFVTALREQMTTRMSQAILLTGDPGCGKTTVMRIIARSLQCDHQKVWGNPCKDCLTAEFDLHETNAADENGIDDMRALAERARYHPTFGKFRVFMVDECQALTSQAQKILLKPIEEPSPTTVWIFGTNDPSKLSEAMHRRFTAYHLKALGPKGTEILLTKAAKYVELKQPLKPLLDAIVELGSGSPGRILMALEKYASGIPAKAAATGLDETPIETLGICKAVTAGDWNSLRSQLAQMSPEGTRMVQASISGWIKGALLREEQPKRQEALAQALVELNSYTAPLDDKPRMLWLMGSLYKICRRLG